MRAEREKKGKEMREEARGLYPAAGLAVKVKYAWEVSFGVGSMTKQYEVLVATAGNEYK